MVTHLDLRKRARVGGLVAGLVVGLLLLLLPACDSSGAPSSANAKLRLGYFLNVTHASAIVGVEKGIFRKALGSGTTLETRIFNAGPAAVEALFSGALDAAYIGPNPAINAYAQSKGTAIRILSGATSGGAFLIVNPLIGSAADLRGKKIASPQRGNTQDVALRAWLQTKGLRTDLDGGGDVSVVPQENAQTLETFKTGDIDGAWVPEPWASRLVLEGNGRVLVDERDLWPGRRYVTTHLIVRTEFLEQNRAAVAALVRGQIEANEFVNENGAEAKSVVSETIATLTGNHLSSAVLNRAWSNLVFTNDPISSSLRTAAKQAVRLGLLDQVDLNGIYDLSILNAALVAAGEKEIAAT